MATTLLVAVTGIALIHFFLFRGKSSWLDGIYVLMLVIVMGFCSKNADFIPYKEIYEHISFAWETNGDIFLHSDKGFVLLNLIGTILGLDYVSFRFFLLLLPLMLLFTTVRRMRIPVCAFFLLYLMYPFFMDAIQIRNFIIESSLFFCIYLCACRNWHAFIVVPLFIVAAAAIQPLTLMYIPFFVFHALYKREKWRCIPYFFVAIGTAGIFFRKNILEEWRVIGHWMEAHGDLLARAAGYFGRGAADSRFLKLYIVILLLTLLLYYARKRLQQAEGDSLASRFASLAYQFYLYQICFFPVFVLDINFATRFPRNLLPLAYGAILLSLPYVQSTWKRHAIFAIVLFLAFYFGLVDLYISSLRGEVWLILENNFLFR